MLNFKIVDVEVLDFNQHDSELTPAGISVLVTVDVDGTEHSLDYQTSITHDYGAYSSILEPYDSSLADLDLYCDDLAELEHAIKTSAKAEAKWREYIERNYILNDTYFGGIDANSEINEMQRV